MADLGKVLQALGALSSGVGSTILSVQERRRREEEEEERRQRARTNDAYMQTLLANQGVDVADAQGTVPAMDTPIPTPEPSRPGVEVRPSESLEGTLGLRRSVDDLAPGDPRTPLANNAGAIDLEKPERMAREAAKRKGAEVMRALDEAGVFDGVDERALKAVASLATTGVLTTPGEIQEFVGGLKSKEIEDTAQQFFFQRIPQLASRLGIEDPTGGEFVEGYDYGSLYNMLFNGNVSVATSRAAAAASRTGGGGDGGGGGDPGAGLAGAAINSLRNTESVAATVRELKRKYPDMSEDELTEIVFGVWVKNKEEIIDMGPSTRRPQQSIIQGTPDGSPLFGNL